MTKTTTHKKPSAALIEKHRDINVDHEWWDCTYADFKTEMEERHGIDVKDFQFTGFCSQGDGASFTGRVESNDMVKFFKSLSLDTSHPLIFEYVSDSSQPADIEITRSCSRYSHANTCSAELRANNGWGPSWEALLTNESEDAFSIQCGAIRDIALKVELEDFEGVLNRAVRALMDDLYRLLNDEYDYLTSDEAIIEALEDHDLCDEEDDEDQDDDQSQLVIGELEEA